MGVRVRTQRGGRQMLLLQLPLPLVLSLFLWLNLKSLGSCVGSGRGAPCWGC